MSGQEIPPELADAHKKYTDSASNAFTQLTVSATSTFASLLVQGKLNAKAFGTLALDTLDSVINTYIAQILAIAIAQLGPIAGPIAGALAIASVKGLVAIAKSSVVGAYKGVYKIDGNYKTKPGPGDEYPALLKKGESVATAEATVRNPVIKAIVKDGLTEEQYYNKVYLPKQLATLGIKMPSLNMSVMPLELNEKAIRDARESAKRLELLHNRYEKIDKENLAIAIQREREYANEQKKNNELLNAILVQSKQENKELIDEVRQLKVDIKRNTKLNLDLIGKIKGTDIELALKAKDRRSVY
jgi:hypothetical protein